MEDKTMNKNVKKIINFAIALLAITACFQIISVNKYRLFASNDTEISEIRDKIVSTLDVKEEVEMAAKRM